MTQHLAIRPFSAWFIGPSNPLNAQVGSLVAEALRDLGIGRLFLDENVCRAELWPEVKETSDSELESVRRAAKLCRLTAEAGLSAIVASRSPSADLRRDIQRDLGEYVEIYCSVGQSAAEPGSPNDSAGLRFEEPVEPDVTLDAGGQSIRESARIALTWLNEMGYLSPEDQPPARPDDESTVLKRLEELGYI